MKKIVIDARIISSSTGRYVERLLTYLEQIDHENSYTVLVRSKDKDYWQPTNKNFEIKIADYKNFSFGEQIGFSQLLYSLKADLVHFCMPQQPIFYFKPSITTVHDLILLKTYNSDKNWMIYHAKQLVGRFVFWYLAHKSRYIITPSDFSREEYLERYRIRTEKLVTTHLAADITKIKSQKMSLPYKKYIMYVGQQSNYKNIRRLILAHQQLLHIHPDLGLVLVGSKSVLTKRNEVWVKKNNYQNITFTGFVEDTQLAWLYQHCSAYVFPSLMEGFGLPGLEAMAQGAPVVSSNATCLPEIYGNAAHYFDPLNVDDMTQKINEVLTDERLRKKLLRNSQQQIKKYSWKKMAHETLRVYTQAMNDQ
jgi:glycosyltransferase involved in cell wall biosynthesis